MEPEYLKRWTLPDNYVGEIWPNYYVFLRQHRDSDAMGRSNFRAGLKAIGGESDTVQIVRESHWAVGWVEWIAIHQDDAAALKKADEIKKSMEDYPVVDESDFSEVEDEDAGDTWRNCYDWHGRIAYIREHRDQFEFCDLADMVRCVRGEYFAGYASELIV